MLLVLIPALIFVLIVIVCLIFLRKKMDGVIMWHYFLHSTYITSVWNWFMELAGKAAEPVLFATVLYSGYELLPGVPQPGAGLDAFVFICQMVTLDIGGLGLIKIAQNKNLDRHSFPQRVGYVLLGLMIANVSLAMLKRIVPIAPGVENGIEGTLLLARAVMAVLYGYAIHSLKDDASESTVVVKVATVNQQIVELENKFTEHIQAITEQSTEQIRLSTENTERRICSVEQRLTEHTDRQFRSVLANITEKMEALTESDRTNAANITEQVSVYVQPLVEALDQQGAALAEIKRELRDRIRPNTEKRTVANSSESSVNVPPNIRQFAPKNTEHRTPNEFDKGSFVRSCLTEIPNIRNSEIQRKAEEFGQVISPSYISEIRKALTGELPAVNE